MTQFSTYVTNTNQDNIDDLSGYTKALLAIGHFRIPHKGHKTVFEQLNMQAGKLNVKPIIAVISESIISRKEPLSESVKVQMITYLNEQTCNVVTWRDVYEAVHKMITVDRVLPIGDVLGEPNNLYEKTVRRVLLDCGIKQHDYTSYAVTRKYQSNNVVDHVNQLSSDYLIELVLKNNTTTFVDHYRDLGLTNENITGLYVGIQQGLLKSLTNERIRIL